MSGLASAAGQFLATLALGFLKWWSQRHDQRVIERQQWIIRGLELDAQAEAYVAAARQRAGVPGPIVGVRDPGARLEVSPDGPDLRGVSGAKLPDPPH